MDLIAHTQQCLDRIQKHNKELNIILHLNENSLEDAQRIQQKINNGTAGKLAGKIIGIKSCINVEGLIANCASKTLENYKATYDADAIKFIKEQDGLIIGMLNMDEFASGASGETSAFGPAQNPKAPGYITGGSSSGSAAGVAAGFFDLALGTDTGGSIRNPASHCGIVGIKPSYGRVSRYGLIDLSMSLDQIGPFANNVNDAALLLDIISKKSEHDGTMRDDIFELKPIEQTPQNLRIGIPESLRHLCTDQRIWNLIMQWTDKFTTTYGANKINLDLKNVDLAVQTYYPIVYVEFYSGTRKFDGRKYGHQIEQTCGVEVLRRILGGKIISHSEFEGKYYKKALAAKKVIAEQINDSFKQCDIIVMPTTPTLPHKIGENVSVEAMYGYDAFTIPANLAGCCAGVVPIGTIDNVPVGLQIYAAPGNEQLLVQAMRGFEKLVHQ